MIDDLFEVLAYPWHTGEIDVYFYDVQRNYARDSKNNQGKGDL